jgi:type VI secretion system secreted protein VgrG
MEEYGINYWFEHKDGSHVLVLGDSLSAFKPMDSVAYTDLWTYPPDLKLGEEYISKFNPRHSHTSGQYTGMDYQFKDVGVTQTTNSHNPWETAHKSLEIVEWNQGDFLDASSEGDFKARIYMEGLRQHGKRAEASGNLRGIQVGHTFNLHNHPTEAVNRSWLVLETHYEIEETIQETGSNQAFSVKVDFTVQPDTEQLRPERITPKPRAGTQTATVVGPEKNEVWVDQYGRIKVQFHWDRLGQKNEHSSCWVRVSSPWAGMNYGGIQHPRVGQEVIVDWFHDDPDMPFVSGRLVNPEHMPLWELPSQHALSGFKSKEIDGSRNNHLIMDDTPSQIQVQLTSDHGLSQLNLGHITRIPDPAGRKDYRGQGFELRTDDKGAIRAAQGLLITTAARNAAQFHHTDLDEALNQLTGSQSQHAMLSKLAKEHNAEELSAHQRLLIQNYEIAGQAPPAALVAAAQGIASDAATPLADIPLNFAAIESAMSSGVTGAFGDAIGGVLGSVASTAVSTLAGSLTGELSGLYGRAGNFTVSACSRGWCNLSYTFTLIVK